MFFSSACQWSIYANNCIHHKGGGSEGVIPPRRLKNRENHPTENSSDGVQTTLPKKIPGGLYPTPENFARASAAKFLALFWPIPPRKKACGGVVSTPENSKILPYHPTEKNFGGVVPTPLTYGDLCDVCQISQNFRQYLTEKSVNDVVLISNTTTGNTIL